MKINIKFLLICAGTIIVIFILISYFKNDLIENESLKNSLANQISNNDVIKFKSLTDFEWDKMYIVTPYRDLKLLRKKYHIKDIQKISTRVEVTEGFNLLIFTANNKVISYVNFPVYYGDFEAERILLNRIEYTKDTANFRVIIKNGQKYLIDMD